MAWYVSETESTDTLEGPFLTHEEATDAADFHEANNVDTEVYYVTGEGDVEDDLRRQLALGQGDDMNNHQ
jgi:hypothetical protein